MHELAIAEGILGVVLDVAQGEPVQRVRLRIGALQRVAPDSLQFCFELVADDTLAAAAILDITPVAGDELLVDGVELPGGWRVRPGAPSPAVPVVTN